MLQWLAADLNTTKADAAVRWLIAIFHHPPYSFGGHNSDLRIEGTEMRVVRSLPGLSVSELIPGNPPFLSPSYCGVPHTEPPRRTCTSFASDHHPIPMCGLLLKLHFKNSVSERCPIAGGSWCRSCDHGAQPHVRAITSTGRELWSVTHCRTVQQD